MWYSLLDQILRDTNTNLGDCSDPTDTWYVQENYHNEIAGGERNISDDEEEDIGEETNTSAWQTSARINTKEKTCGEPSSEKEILRSQTQVLSQLAGSLNQLVESHTKGQLEQRNYEKERDKAFLEFKKQEAEKTVSMR